MLAQTLSLRCEGKDASVRLSGEFRKKLVKEFGLNKTGVKECFVAMDYHLDWIHGSLPLAYRDKDKLRVRNGKEIFPYKGDEVTGTPEDIDLLVVLEVDSKYQFILIEAKGYSGWDTKQLCSKAERLGKIFGECGERYGSYLEPHFALMSQKTPQTKNWEILRQPASWPKWMRNEEHEPHHLTMSLPPKCERRRVERCDENGQSWDGGKRFHCPPA